MYNMRREKKYGEPGSRITYTEKVRRDNNLNSNYSVMQLTNTWIQTQDTIIKGKCTCIQYSAWPNTQPLSHQ